MLPIENCKSNPSQYHHDMETYFCPECMDGYYRDGDECEECPAALQGNGCVTCIDETTCAECEDGYIMHPNGQDGPSGACIMPFEYCQLLPFQYDITINEETEEYERFWCSECISGYAWNFDDEECQECVDLFDHCTSNCTYAGCTECESGFVVGDDGQCWPEYANCEEHAWLDDEFGVYCSECEEGLFFMIYADEPDQITPSPQCIDCDDEAWGIEFCESCSNVFMQDILFRLCDKCEGGYTPSPSQMRCIPKIEFAEVPLED